MLLIFVLAFLIALPFIIIISTRLMWFVGFIADRNEGPIEALQSSYRFSRGNFLALFGLAFTYNILGGVVTLCTCGLGTVIAMPLFYCYTAVAYLTMTGQTFGDRW